MLNTQTSLILVHVFSDAIEVNEKMAPVEIVMVALPAVGFLGSFVVVRKILASISRTIAKAK